MATKKRTEIECIECKNMIRFPEYIGVDFRTGELKCDKCESKLRIKLNKWKVVDYYTVKEKGGAKSKEARPSEKLLEYYDTFGRLKDIAKNDEAG